MGQLTHKLPYALVLGRETSEDVPPPHDDPQVRVVYLTDKEREALEAELITTRGVLSEQDDQASYYLDLVLVKDAGAYADAMAFLHELVPDEEDGDEVDEEEVDEDDLEEEDEADTALAVALDSAGVRGRIAGGEIELTRQVVPGSEEHGDVRIHDSEFPGMGIDWIGNGTTRGAAVVVVGGLNGGTVYYDDRADEWFSY